VDKKAETVG
jgi:hypothetical protein